MNYCLIQEKAQEFLKRIKDGKIVPERLEAMSSKERIAFFKEFLDDQDAKAVNILLERKLLNKNRESALVSWAEEVSGKNMKQKQALIEKIEKNTKERNKRLFAPEEDETFLNELVDMRLGIGISEEESRTLFNLSKKFKETKALFNKNSIYDKLSQIKDKNLTPNEKKVVDEMLQRLDDVKEKRKLTGTQVARIKRYLGEKATPEQRKDIEKLVDDIVKSRREKGLGYGSAKVALDEYIGDIKLGIKKKRTIASTVEDVFGFSKAVLASIDNSFIGRQGLKTLYTGHPIIWFKTFKESFKILGKSGILGQDALRGVRATILSRKNSRNGLYERMKLDIGVTEEAYPTSLPAKIPLLGRAFKASEQSFTGSAYYMRAELADTLIEKAQRHGVDLNNKEQAEALGELINSMTGRGKIDILSDKGQRLANVTLFSAKFLKSQIDVVGLMGYGKSSFVRKEAAKNLASIVASMAGVMYMANILKPGSAELDPRSSDFGKIKIGNTRFDISGGMTPLVTLAARIIAPMFGKAQIKTTTTGELVERGAFGSKTAMGLMAAFLENKAAPTAGLILDVFDGKNFDKTPITMEALKEDPATTMWAIGKTFLLPIPVENAMEAYKNKETEPALASVLLDMLGFGSNTYTQTGDWTTRTSKEMAKFKEEKGYKTLKKAGEEYAEIVNKELLKKANDEEFLKLTPEEKGKEIDKIKRDTKKGIFTKYNFKP